MQDDPGGIFSISKIFLVVNLRFLMDTEAVGWCRERGGEEEEEVFIFRLRCSNECLNIVELIGRRGTLKRN